MGNGLMGWLAVIAGVLLFASAAIAEEITIPNTFTNGTVADADEVNANFAAVEVGVDDNAADIDALQAIDPITLPTATGYNADPEFGGTGTSPYVGADQGAVTGAGDSQNCLPAYERYHGSC